MTPYYADDLVTIYHGDCREWMPEADVIITDPPYGIGVDYGSNVVDSKTELNDLVAAIWPRMETYSRVALTPGVANLHAWPAPRWTMCWFDPGGTGSGPWGFATWQPIMVWGPDPFLADGKGRRPDGLLLMQRGDPDRKVNHPCPKPVNLLRWLITRVSRPNETVLDPFMGSGTTLVAAKDLGRRAIGIEIEERYCEIAAQRCSQEVLGLTA